MFLYLKWFSPIKLLLDKTIYILLYFDQIVENLLNRVG